MKVFVIGSSAEDLRVRNTMSLLEDVAGVEIVHDWLSAVEEHGSAVGVDPAVLREESEKNKAAVLAADLVVALLPDHAYFTNFWIELGYVVGMGRANRTILAGNRECVLYRYEPWFAEVGTDEAAVAVVRAAAGGYESWPGMEAAS